LAGSGYALRLSSGLKDLEVVMALGKKAEGQSSSVETDVNVNAIT
jgi:hypothetical protein